MDRGVHLGSWDRAEDYAHDIIQVLDDVIYFRGIPCELIILKSHFSSGLFSCLGHE